MMVRVRATMATTPTTSHEEQVRSALLDVLHAQWRALGVPFTGPDLGDQLEVIDPEALLWSSLHFFGHEARLEEGVRSWFADNRLRVNRQRLNSIARRHPDDPRAAAWRSLDDSRRSTTRRHVGAPASQPASLHLRSREVLGNDCSAYLIVALLGSPRGVRCRVIADSSGYTYRAVSDAASSWASAGIVRLERGFCTVIDPTPWTQLLKCDLDSIVTVDWHAAYENVIAHLRMLARARSAGIDPDNALVVAAAGEVDDALRSVAAGVLPERAPAISALRRAVRL
jgi:hypothetical protein